jgi:hypothetical protein
MATSTSSALLPGPELVAFRRRELAYARLLGLGTGLFLLVWAPLSLERWLTVAPTWAHIESWYLAFFGALLLVPYSRVRGARAWRVLFGAFAVASLIYVFVLVFDVLYVANLYVDNQTPTAAAAATPAPDNVLYVYSDDTGPEPKLPFPVLNCALLFLGLLQAPVVLFSRHPDWLD